MATGDILSVCHDILAAGVVLYVVEMEGVSTLNLFVIAFSLTVAFWYPITLRFLVFETQSSNFVESPAASRELNKVIVLFEYAGVITFRPHLRARATHTHTYPVSP